MLHNESVVATPDKEGETCVAGVCTPSKDEGIDGENAASPFYVGSALFALIMA